MKKLLLCFLLFIMFAGCSTYRATLTYDATPTPEVNAFFIDGLSIASSQTDSCYFSLAIHQRSIIGRQGHLKVWFLYQNLASAPYLLRPWNILKLHIIDSVTGKVYTTVPETPNKIMTKIDKQEASETFLSLFGGALQSIRASSSDLAPQDKWSVNKQIIRNTTSDIISTQLWYSLVRSSVSSGLLQKNTVLPEESVNGFVYFPLRIDKKILTNEIFESKRWKCRIEVITPTENREIEFSSVDLE